MSDVIASLSVNCQHLLQALRQINAVTGIGRQGAILTYSEGNLQIALGGCSFRAEATGDWNGQVKVPVSFIRRLAKAPPEGDGSILVSTDGTSLRIGFVVTKCKWSELALPRITLPMHATLLNKLELRFRYSTEDIRRSHLTRTINAAEAQRDELIEKAAHVLQPLDIKASDIRRLVDDRLKATLRGSSTCQ